MLAQVRNEKRVERTPRLVLGLATRSSDVDAALRLRHRVFVDAMGASAKPQSPGREQDFFDAWCEHLVVRDLASGEVAGTYRVLTAEKARRLGTYCAEREFDLTRLARLRPRLMEIGRACIDPAYRAGATARLLWSGLTLFARQRGAAYLIGCASVSMADGGSNAAAVYEHLSPRHLAPTEYRVVPRSPLAALGDPVPSNCPTPQLVEEYIRLGGWIAGEPAWDPDFNTADLPVFLPLTRVKERRERPCLRETLAA